MQRRFTLAAAGICAFLLGCDGLRISHGKDRNTSRESAAPDADASEQELSTNHESQPVLEKVVTAKFHSTIICDDKANVTTVIYFEDSLASIANGEPLKAIDREKAIEAQNKDEGFAPQVSSVSCESTHEAVVSYAKMRDVVLKLSCSGLWVFKSDVVELYDGSGNFIISTGGECGSWTE